MKIFSRYAFFQTLKIFLVTLAATTLGFFFFSVVKTSLEGGIPVSLPLRMTPYIIPDVLSKTLPIASLRYALFFSNGEQQRNYRAESVGDRPLARSFSHLGLYVFR